MMQKKLNGILKRNKDVSANKSKKDLFWSPSSSENWIILISQIKILILQNKNQYIINLLKMKVIIKDIGKEEKEEIGMIYLIYGDHFEYQK